MAATGSPSSRRTPPPRPQECSAALELQPAYTKALLRRCAAYEKLDDLEHALLDAQKARAWLRNTVAAALRTGSGVGAHAGCWCLQICVRQACCAWVRRCQVPGLHLASPRRMRQHTWRPSSPSCSCSAGCPVPLRYRPPGAVRSPLAPFFTLPPPSLPPSPSCFQHRCLSWSRATAWRTRLPSGCCRWWRSGGRS